MNSETKSNLIASIILALVPFGFLGLIGPSGDLLAGLAVTAALIGLVTYGVQAKSLLKL